VVGVTGFEPATPTSRKMSHGFRFSKWISPLQAKRLKIWILLFSCARPGTLFYSPVSVHLSPQRVPGTV
jgi:hypothetical protein